MPAIIWGAGLFGLFLIAASTAFSAWSLVIAHRVERNAYKIALLERRDSRIYLNQCLRVQEERENANRSFVWLYLANRAAVVRETRLIGGPDSDVHRDSAKLLATVRDHLMFRPATDCAQASLNPEHYRRPPSIPFSALSPERLRIVMRTGR